MSFIDKGFLMNANLDTREVKNVEGRSISFYNTDKNISVLYMKLTFAQKGEPQNELQKDDVAGYKINITAIKPKTNQYRIVEGILTDDLVDESCAIWKFGLDEEFTNQIGPVTCWTKIIDGDKVLNMNSFAYDVNADGLTGLNEEIVTDKDLPILEELIGKVQKVNNINDIKVSQTETYSNKKIEEKFDGVNAQFNTIATNVPMNISNMFNNIDIDFVGDLKGAKIAIQQGVANVVFVGDSITEYSDAIDENDLYYNYYTKELKRNFPNCIFNSYNRAIRSTTLANFADVTYIPTSNVDRPWTTTNTKVWREAIKDLQPDILFIAFGMNISEMPDNYKIIFDYIKTWSKVPSIILISNPMPSKQYYNEDNYNLRVRNARQTREIAKKYKLTLIDAGRRYRMAVDGIDELSRYSILESTFSVSSHNFTAINEKIVSTKKLYNFHLSCDVKLNTSYFRLEFRKGKSVIQIQSNNGAVRIYDKEGNMLVSSYMSSYADWINVSVKVVDNNVKVYINNVLFAETNEVFYELIDDVISISSIIGGNLQINNLKVIEYKPTNTLPVATEETIFGTYNASDFGQKLPYGGNGLNHPCSIGNKLLYFNGITNVINYIRQTNIILQGYEILQTIINTEFKAPSSANNWDVTTTENKNIYYKTLNVDNTSGLNVRIQGTSDFYKFRNDITAKNTLKNLKEGEFAIVFDNMTYLLFIASDLNTNVQTLECIKPIYI